MSEQQQKVNKPDGIYIKSQEMGTTFATKLITSDQLAKLIYGVFTTVSPDFDGVVISLSKRERRIVAELSFSDDPTVNENNLGSNEFKFIQPLNANTGSRAGAIIANYNRRNNTTKKFEFTDVAKKLLDPFIPRFDKNDVMIRHPQNGKIDWDRAYYENFEQTVYGSTTKIYSFIPFNIEYFLSKLYGEKSTDGGRFTYALQYIRPIAPVGNYANGNMIPLENVKFLLGIFKMENNSVQRICEEAGMSVMQNTLNIIRG